MLELLTAHPFSDPQRSGPGRLLVPWAPAARSMGRCAASDVRHAGPYTFAESPKHVALYQRYDFAPHYLTDIGGKPVTARTSKKSEQGSRGPRSATRTRGS